MVNKMGYTVEILSAVVRVGPGHRVLGDPWDFGVVVVSADGHIGVIKALNKERPGEDPIDFTNAHAKQILAGVRHGLKLKPDWVRIVKGRPKRRHKRPAKLTFKRTPATSKSSKRPI